MKNAGIRTSTLACTNSISGTRRDASRMHVLQFEVCFRSLSSVTKRRAGELATERDPRVAGGDGRPSGDATNRGAAPAGNRRVARETSAVDDFARNDHAGGNTAAAVRAGRRRGDVHRAVAADRLAAPRDRQGVRRRDTTCGCRCGGWRDHTRQAQGRRRADASKQVEADGSAPHPLAVHLLPRRRIPCWRRNPLAFGWHWRASPSSTGSRAETRKLGHHKGGAGGRWRGGCTRGPAPDADTPDELKPVHCHASLIARADGLRVKRV